MNREGDIVGPAELTIHKHLGSGKPLYRLSNALYQENGTFGTHTYKRHDLDLVTEASMEDVIEAGLVTVTPVISEGFNQYTFMGYNCPIHVVSQSDLLNLADHQKHMETKITQQQSALETTRDNGLVLFDQLKEKSAQIKSLTTTLDSTDEDVAEYIAEIAELKAQLDAATKPKLIKTVFNNLYIDDEDGHDVKLSIDYPRMSIAEADSHHDYEHAPSNTSRIGYVQHDHWQYPDGTIKVKSKVVPLEDK